MDRLVIMSEFKTYLVYHVDEHLRVVFNEAADCIARILTREDLLNQGGELIRSKRASNQPFTSWSVDVDKKKVPGASVLCTRAGSCTKAEDVPLLDPETLLVNWGPTGAKWGMHLPTPKFSSRGELGALRTLSISWISSLYSSTLPLPYSIRGKFAPLRRVSSISHITLDQIGSEGGRLGGR